MRNLSFEIRALDLFSTAFGRLGRATGQAGEDFNDLENRSGRFAAAAGRMGAKMSVAMTLPGGAFLAGVTRAAADFETSMNRVAAVSNASDADLALMSETARKMGAQTAFSAGEAADAMGFLAMAGFGVAQNIEAIPDVLNLAAAAQMDLAEAADIASNVLTGFGKEVSELASVVDIMTLASTSANTTVAQLGAAMKYAGPIASQAGLSFEETTAAIAKFSDAGIQGEQAGVALRGVLVRLLSPPKMAREALEEMGVAATDAGGKLRPFGDIVADLTPHLGDTGRMMRLFGQEAGPAMLALLGQGAPALDALTEKLGEAGGTADRVAKTQMKGFNGQMKALGSAWGEVQLAIADAGLLESMTDFVGLLRDGAQWLGGLSPETKKWGLILGVALVALGPIVATLGLLVLGLGALAGPIGLAVLAFAAISAGVAYFYDDLTALAETVTGFGGKIGEAVSGFAGGVVDDVRAMGSDAVRYVGQMVDKIASLFTDKLKKAFDFVGEGVETVKGAFFGLWDAVVGHSYVPDMVDGIAEHFARLDGIMVAPAKAAAGEVSSIFAGVQGDVAKALGGMFGAAVGGGSFDWRSAVGGIGGKVIEAVVMKQFAPAAPVGGAAPAVPTSAFADFSAFLGFARGGVFSGGAQMFANGGVVNGATAFAMAGGGLGVMGEAGPEAIMPLSRGKGGKLGVAVQGGGGPRISIGNIDARGAVDPAATARAVREAMAVAIARIEPTVRDMRRRGGV